MKILKLSLIDKFMLHPLAANLLMALMVLAGVFSLTRLNTQLLPSYSLNYVIITVVWPGANADDVVRSITTPLEQDLRTLDHLKEITSISRQGLSYIVLEFQANTDMSKALDDTKQSVTQLRNLPEDAERPIITRYINYEPIAKILITGPEKLSELRHLSHQFEQQLLARGISKIDVMGLPQQEIAIQIPSSQLSELGLSLEQIAQMISIHSEDSPSGTVGRHEVSRQLRSLSQQRDVPGFSQLPLLSNKPGQLTRLGDIAIIQQRSQIGETEIFYHGKPAVELSLFRDENGNSLKYALILHKWLDYIQPRLIKGVKLHVHNEIWLQIKQRINLLLINGIEGFLLILIILFTAVNYKMAFWTALGIPISILAALGLLYLVGGSINMVTLFAFIMALGIIVDDTIVIGEEALTQLEVGRLQQGQETFDAIRFAARKMLIPILASSLTTIAAFLPLMLVRGYIGEFMIAIPIVVICIIIASLIESFFVLPGHLLHSLKGHTQQSKRTNLRQKIDNALSHFTNNTFRHIIVYCVKHRWVTLTTIFSIFLLSLGLVFGGRVGFSFFPTTDDTTVTANVQFVAGTTKKTRQQFLHRLEQELVQTDKNFHDKNKNQSLLTTHFTVINRRHEMASEVGQTEGEEYAHLYAELTEPDKRNISNKEFITAWRKKIQLPPQVENFTIISSSTGPAANNIEINLSASNARTLKKATTELKEKLKTYHGVSEVQDNFPFGQEEIILTLAPKGYALGLSINDINRQLHAAFTGSIAQIFHLPYEEIEVRVTLPDEERFQLKTLEQLPIITHQGTSVPLDNVVNLKIQRGFNLLRHIDSKLSATITAEVDTSQTNTNNVLTDLQKNTIPQLMQQYAINVHYGGQTEEQATTLQDLKYGMLVAIILIYIILAWVFASYSLPLLVMSVIPLGLTGAILGHYLIGIDLTLFSLFGFFGLSGIVINDSIILVSHYLTLRKTTSAGIISAVTDTAVQRFRAVLLTSLTTIAGLTPLLLERSIQAQFLIPMAVSITFGLMFATVLVLILIPCLIVTYEYNFPHSQYRSTLQFK